MTDASTESLNEIIHKEKKQKKTTDIRSSVNSLVDSSTVVKGSTAVNSLPEQLQEHQNRQKSIAKQRLHDAERNTRLMLNLEISESIEEWVLTGLTSEQFMPWVAKCCHTLGLAKVRQIANSARNGKQPERLFSSLLKGALQLHHKREYYQEQ